MADFLNKLDQKASAIQDENKTKLMYSCARKTGENRSILSNIVGVLIIITGCIYIIFKITNGNSIRLVDFTKNHEIGKLLVGLMLLSNVKNLSNSLTSNVILPLVEPVLPFLLCKLNITVGPVKLEFGDFVSDLIVFTINLFIIYFVFVILS